MEVDYPESWVPETTELCILGGLVQGPGFKIGALALSSGGVPMDTVPRFFHHSPNSAALKRFLNDVFLVGQAISGMPMAPIP